MVQVRVSAGSDPGKVRSRNEDNHLVDGELGLYVVADGVGGGPAGEIASQSAVEEIHEFLVEAQPRLVRYSRSSDDEFRRNVLSELSGAIKKASASIFEAAEEDDTLYGMATTVDALLLLGSSAFIGHVGDSRVYLIRGGRLFQLTEDHSLGQRMLAHGKLTEEDLATFPHRNVIVRSLGSHPEVEPDAFWLNIQPGDRFILCTDGLTDLVEDEEIETIARMYDSSELVERLIHLANQRGGKDNITVVVANPVITTAQNRGASPLDWTLRVEHLKRVFIFQQLTDQELLKVLRIVYEERRGAGSVLIREGEYGDRLHVLVKGTVEVSLNGVRLQTLSAGQHFGELALIDDSPRAATVRALDAVRMLTIQRGDFLELLDDDDELARKLLWAFLGDVTSRLRTASFELATAKKQQS